MLSVLVGCESSGTIREAFRAMGHDAVSCDLLPADDGSPYHFQGDVFEAIRRGSRRTGRWDLIILHPPCTALAVSGNAHYGTGKPKAHLREEAIDWTVTLWNFATAYCDYVALENPVGVLSNHLGRPSYVQPFEHGHSETKKTGLWLHNLPKLVPTKIMEKPECGYWDNCTPSGQNKLGPSDDRWKIRSKTYQGIADAIADQWSRHIKGEKNGA